MSSTKEEVAVQYRFLIAPGNGGCGVDIKGTNWYGWFDRELTARGHTSVCVNWPDPYRCHQSVWLPFAAKQLDVKVFGNDDADADADVDVSAEKEVDAGGDEEKKDTLKIEYRNIIVGHSTGALLVMRMLERCPSGLYGAILVSAAHTDLDDEGERASGFFDEPWDWARMGDTACVGHQEKEKKTLRFIHQFHSVDDHLIPVAEARFVARQLSQSIADRKKENEEEIDSVAHFEYEELTGYGHFFDPFQPLLDVVDKWCKE